MNIFVPGIDVDMFAGGGGASSGILAATGKSPEIAINHNDNALSMHEANHPETMHILENIWKVAIDDYTDGRQINNLWASPDCRHFSKARGGKPTSKSVRGLAWSIVRFVHDLGRNRPMKIFLENVEEFLGWEDFNAWAKELKRYGYKMEHKQLRACDYGAPTIRKRLFIIMRRDGKKIVWPKPTHGKLGSPAVISGKLKPWRTAAEIIDWSIPCPSIFDTKAEIKEKFGLNSIRPLADNTLKRVAAGVFRYVIEAEHPFFVSLGQQGGSNRSAFDPMSTITASQGDMNCVVTPTLVNVANSKTTGRGPNTWDIEEPTRTITSSPGFAVVAPQLIQMGYGDKLGQKPRVLDLDKPVGTITAQGNKFALVSAFLAQHNTQRSGVNSGREVDAPLSTITGRGTQQNIVAANMIHLKGSNRNDASVEAPLNTITAGGTHAGLIAAFLTKYYGVQQAPDLHSPLHTITTKDRFTLVVVHINGDPYVITDIGMRMLTPRELFRAQGFPPEYIIDRGADGRVFTKTEQIHKCGNSVPPPLVEAIVGANQ